MTTFKEINEALILAQERFNLKNAELINAIETLAKAKSELSLAESKKRSLDIQVNMIQEEIRNLREEGRNCRAELESGL